MILLILLFSYFKLQSTPVGTTIFRNIQAQDQDAGVNGLVEYFLVEGSQNISVPDTLTAADGYGVFAISYPHQGQVSVKFYMKLVLFLYFNREKIILSYILL